ncbi:hypothetical protein DFH07DRAFT_856556 [Mycena maculata]|uniref:Secreted protein n=1 Tax=Mycena maculata TaxID=230809 RepID=A0AAD7MLB4_9AGAR|nr:hypothetical protein DFH07DRAFT_856556 [Mycena maculata]
MSSSSTSTWALLLILYPSLVAHLPIETRVPLHTGVSFLSRSPAHSLEPRRSRESGREVLHPHLSPLLSLIYTYSPHITVAEGRALG